MSPTPGPDVARIAEGVRRGGRRELAQAITLVESDHPRDRELAEALMESLRGDAKGAVRIGISGPPGVGKSTLIEALGGEILKRGQSLAVLAIDPSSEASGGSLLADKTRMPGLAAAARAYVRPSPSRAELGGVAPRTQEACVLCEAAGFDTVLVETVGVGQSEHAAKNVVDCLVVLALPGSGDEIQGMKRGLLEHADVVVVNKADGLMLAAAERTRSDLESALAMSARDGEVPEVLSVSALEGRGISALLDTLDALVDRFRRSGELERRSRSRLRRWTQDLVEQGLIRSYFADPDRRAELEQGLRSAELGESSPQAAARAILNAWFPKSRSG